MTSALPSDVSVTSAAWWWASDNTTAAVDLVNTTAQLTLKDQPINVPGLVVVIIFFALILALGVFASWRSKSLSSANTEEVMLAGRNLGLFTGIMTLCATGVGGGYINGTAEYVYTPGYGLIWCQAPVLYSISIALGGVIFAKKMRQAGYVTMLDPFQERYGRVLTALIYIPALLGEIFWSAAILAALGATLSVILGVNHIWAVVISAAISVFYTLIGGLYSVAFTDIIQLICVFFGLWLGVGFGMANSVVRPIRETAYGENGWLGTLPNTPWVGLYVDLAFQMILGGMPWQDLFQRVLAARTVRTAQILAVVGGIGCAFMAIPAVVIGAIAKSADWSKTEYAKYRPVPIPPEDYGLALPLVLQYLTPTAVSVIGLGAVSAAVMSSSDSSILAASTMFARNIYQPFRNYVYPRRIATDTEVLWLMRCAILVVGVIATVIALSVRTIYGIFTLCTDLVYVILFPQLLCVVHLPFANAYGALVSFVVSLLLRLLSGEPLFSFPACIRWPYHVDDGRGIITQRFPFKTLIMLMGLIIIASVSYIAEKLFKKGIIPARYDVFEQIVRRKFPSSTSGDVARGSKHVMMTSSYDVTSKAAAEYSLADNTTMEYVVRGDDDSEVKRPLDEVDQLIPKPGDGDHESNGSAGNVSVRNGNAGTRSAASSVGSNAGSRNRNGYQPVYRAHSSEIISPPNV